MISKRYISLDFIDWKLDGDDYYYHRFSGPASISLLFNSWFNCISNLCHRLYGPDYTGIWDVNDKGLSGFKKNFVRFD